MKNKEVPKYLDAIEDVKDLKLGGTITLLLVKNKKILNDGWDTLEATRLDICKRVSEREENGEPKMNEDKSNYVFTPESKKQASDEYNEMMENDSGLVLFTFPLGLLQQFKDITLSQMESLMLFVEQ